MYARAVRGLCRLLTVTVLMLSCQVSWAGMIGTSQMVAAAQSGVDRTTVQRVLARGELRDQLRALGVDPKAVDERVAALTDQEVQTLAGQIEAAPAGGVWGWIALAVLIIIGFMAWGSTPSSSSRR